MAPTRENRKRKVGQKDPRHANIGHKTVCTEQFCFVFQAEKSVLAIFCNGPIRYIIFEISNYIYKLSQLSQ
jgi:hypothetical protein